MATDDPDLPELLRMKPSEPHPDAENTLQRSMSMVSIGNNDADTAPTGQLPPTQVMSVSDEELDWAEQMRQESDDRAERNGSQG